MKSENTKKSIKVGSFIILVILCYLFLFFRWVYGNNITTDFIRTDTLEDSINTDAYIVRDEEVLRSPIDGECINEVGEGEKIPANFRIATILSNTSVKLLDNLNDLDLRIIKAQKEKSDSEDFFSEDVVKIEEDIQQKIKLLVIESNSNSMEDTKQLREDINNLIEKKASIVGSKSTPDVFINDLEKQKQTLQNQIDANTRDITSTASGIISYNVDGYEDQLNPKTIKALTPKILEGVKGSEQGNNSINKNVLAGKPFAKIVMGLDYYVLIPLNPQDVKDLKINDNIDIRINDINKIVSGTLTNISDEIDGKFVVAVKIDSNMGETACLRKINVDLIKTSFSGLKVPLKSLIEYDPINMKAKIVLVKANYATIKEVKIIGKNEESAIIANLEDTDKGIALYDIYVINPENIKEGQLISQ